MPIFQISVVQKHLENLDKNQVELAYQKFLTNYNPAKIAEIKTLKEEEYQDGFLRDIFVDVLGYTLRPEENYNLQREYKNQADSKKADGAIIKDGNAIAVIELKSTQTKDLKNVTQQAFNYKNNQPDCNYVITSNFHKLRFYIDYANEYEEFDLFNLSRERFELLYLILCKESVFNNLPLALKEETKFHEQEISGKLYKDYSQFKRLLFGNLKNNHPESDPLNLFKKSQKLLDRFLFILFAEDSGLLPPNSITRIVKRFLILKEEDAYKPIYDIFKQYFGYMNIGRKGKTATDNIPAYNGGLFYPDPQLDAFKIDDDILMDGLLHLTEYDFNTEVDVNILGHIFEHSLNEIEEITAQIEGSAPDKTKSKRKKDGVFYTPKYITQYIVENTIGTLCTEKRSELNITEIEFDESYRNKNGKLSEKGKKLFAKLTAYKDWLITLKIIDPACGSGAFLNQALNFLIEEHSTIDDIIAELTNAPMRLFDVDKSILENNLFGVDINEESVEIAKLSLWLRTAQKGRKLSSLNNNIKCGNSLIDDPAIAGDKAFDWNIEFKDIMDKGGFDVVIGNPPYVHLESIKYESEKLSKLGYNTYDKRGDLYSLFVEKAFNLTKTKGLLSYIMPNKWLQAGYGKSLREYFLTKNLIQLIDFGDFQIFDGATTYPCIFIAENNSANETFKVSVLSNQKEVDFYSNVYNSNEVFEANEFSGDTWVISSKKEKGLLNRLMNKFESLSNFVAGEANYGIKTGLTEAFIFDSETKNLIINGDKVSSELIHPVLRGRDIIPWHGSHKGAFMLCTFPSLNIDIKKYSAIESYLLNFGKNRLEQSGNNGSRKKTTNKWFETQDAISYHNDFKRPKIMYQKFQVKPCFIYDESGSYCNDSMWIIPTDNKALVGVLNSKMGWWLITKYCTQIQNGCQLIWKYFGQIPIPELSTPELLISSENRLEFTKNLQEKSTRFIKRLQDNLAIQKTTKKLEAFYDFDFKTFVGELKKQKIKLSLTQQDEWEAYFMQYKTEINEIQNQITKTDTEIDKMVYALYGLTEEEIGIVENSGK